MTRPSNSITDLFKGYTLELEKTSSSAVNISSSQNLTTINTLLDNFVEAYNSVYTNISVMTNASFSSDESTGPLAGDSLARSIQRELKVLPLNLLLDTKWTLYYVTIRVQTNRDGTIALNTNTLKSVEANPKIVDAIFKDQLISSDNAEVEVTTIGTDTLHRFICNNKRFGNYNIDGVQMTANGTLYTSGSGNSNGMVVNIASSDVTSANIYFGHSLMKQIDESLTNFLAFNGDINNRISNLNTKLGDFSEQKTSLEERMDRLTERYTIQFASMEQSIAGMKETGNYLDQMLKQEKD